MIPQGHQSKEGGYERKDADVIGVILVAGLILLIMAISYLTVEGLLHLISGSHGASALGQSAVGEKSRFPEPRLQVNPTADLAISEKASESELHSYGWVDRSAGVVHLPIERAMQLLIERGLPEVGAGQTRLQLMQARPTTDVQPKSPTGSPMP